MCLRLETFILQEGLNIEKEQKQKAWRKKMVSWLTSENLLATRELLIQITCFEGLSVALLLFGYNFMKETSNLCHGESKISAVYVWVPNISIFLILRRKKNIYPMISPCRPVKNGLLPQTQYPRLINMTWELSVGKYWWLSILSGKMEDCATAHIIWTRYCRFNYDK